MAVAGRAQVRVLLDPRASFGRQTMTAIHRSEQSTWSARTGEVYLRWSGAEGAEVVPDGDGGRALAASVGLEERTQCDLVLELDTHDPTDPPPAADELWDATATSWRAGLSQTPETTVAGRDVRHGCAVLRGMTSSSGGMVAAATTSLPERAGEGRNYDYRYVWIRDQCFTGQALAAAGPHPLLDDAVKFVSARLLDDGPQLMPAYTTRGEAVPKERPLELSGYPGGHDIIGNRVRGQLQLDAFGESLLLLAGAARHDRLDAVGWRAAEVAADAIAQRWREPDAGVWELEPAAWTESRLSCVAGLRAMSASSAPAPLVRRWIALADTILADTATNGLHRSGRWQRSPGDARVDAALLLPAIRGAVPATDRRSIATFEAVRDELVEEDYVYRYRPDERPLGDAEGAFALCGFLMALACLQHGDLVGATGYFERNRGACGPPGLFTEEFDIRERQLRGNLPQAFVHALLIECAVRRSTMEDQGTRWERKE
jgi:GH15 family glucan-1,4-alpha-glucosidase